MKIFSIYIITQEHIILHIFYSVAVAEYFAS